MGDNDVLIYIYFDQGLLSADHYFEHVPDAV